jgi:hypothetical protein
MTEREALVVQTTLIDVDPGLVVACIEACIECAQACTACADACLSEPAVAELAECVRANLECADMCDSTGRLLSRRTGQHTNLVRAFLDTCAGICRTCAEACERHAGSSEDCRRCAEACRACERACEALVDGL